MPSLGVPRNGLPLEFGGSAPLSGGSLMGITLNDGMIEDMIEAVRNGKGIELSLGADATISYGGNTSVFSRSEDPFAYDIYQKSLPTGASPGSSDTTSQPVARGPRKNNFKMSHLGKSSIFYEPKKPAPRQVTTNAAAKQKKQAPVADKAIQDLKNGMAAANAQKEANTTQFRSSSKLPPAVQRKGPAVNAKNGRQLPVNAAKNLQARNNLGSVPASPLPQPTASASEIRAEKLKAARKPLIHRLAVGPASKDELLALKPDDCTDSEFLDALVKVADRDDATRKYVVNYKILKELDVYDYDYKTDGDRQKAIDAAVKAYDKMRLSEKDPVWDRLNPPSERGQGKCLSVLQAKLAKGPIAPKPRPVAESGDELDDDAQFGDSDRGTGRGAKSHANAKARAQQDKRLSGKATAKSRAPAKKDVSPKKPAPKKAAANNSFKSTEFVNDDDEEEDDYLINQPPVKSKPAPKTVSAGDKNSQGVKRKADGAESGPDSAKRQATAGRIANKSDQRAPANSSNSANGGTTQRKIASARVPKNTSPQKSSPLASSPPTNASELDGMDNKSTTATPPPATNKRKNAGADGDQQPQRKKQRKATEAEIEGKFDTAQFQNRKIAADVVDKRDKWIAMYNDKYKPLHQRLAAMDEDARPAHELERLERLEEELRQKKAELIEAARDV